MEDEATDSHSIGVSLVASSLTETAGGCCDAELTSIISAILDETMTASSLLLTVAATVSLSAPPKGPRPASMTMAASMGGLQLEYL